MDSNVNPSRGAGSVNASEVLCIRRAVFPADMPAVRALHAHLEVAYDESFYTLICSGAAMIVLVAEQCAALGGTDNRIVGVVIARSDGEPDDGILGADDFLVATSWLAGAAASWFGWRWRMAGAAQAPGATAYIMTLVVAPSHRGIGLGSTLLRHSFATLCQGPSGRGCAAVSLHCLISNTRARRLYAREGFVEKQVLRGYYALPGGAVDGLRLYRALSAADSDAAPRVCIGGVGSGKDSVDCGSNALVTINADAAGSDTIVGASAATPVLQSDACNIEMRDPVCPPCAGTARTNIDAHGTTSAPAQVAAATPSGSSQTSAAQTAAGDVMPVAAWALWGSGGMNCWRRSRRAAGHAVHV